MSQWKASVTFPCPFSAFATRCFPTLEQSRGGGGEAWIPSGHQLEGWSCLPTAQEAPGWGWGSLPWDSLGFGWMSSAGTLCSSTTLSTHSSFPMLRGPKCLWAHPSLCTEHGPFVRAHTPHSLVAGGCSVPEGVHIPSLLPPYMQLSDNGVLSASLLQEPGSAFTWGNLPWCSVHTEGNICSSHTPDLFKNSWNPSHCCLPHYWLLLSLRHDPPSFLSHPMADHPVFLTCVHKQSQFRLLAQKNSFIGIFSNTLRFRYFS